MCCMSYACSFDGDIMLLSVSTWKEIVLALEVATSEVAAYGFAASGVAAYGVVET
jgi:hypothetical protein